MLTTLPNRVSALFADPFQLMFRDLDRTLSGSREKRNADPRKVAPLSVWGDENTIHVEMDVPGIALADLEVSLEHGQLTIRGQRQAPDRPANALHEERFFGEFERTVALGEWVDPSSIQATLRDGVLQLKISKKPEAQRQKIEINYSPSPDVKTIPPAE